jgi:AcrR family transcriptional regulator
MSEMTDSGSGQAIAERRPGKRERLVAAATQLLHQQGVERTTLADIAKLADVPAGNVFYYFKTKDEVVAAVVEAHLRQTSAALAAIETHHRSPKRRLKAFLQELTSQSELITAYGCPLGNLSSELAKRAGAQDASAASLMRLPVEWAERQFSSLGRTDAHDLALDLIAAYEGSALLANTLQDPGVVSGLARRMSHWIDSL